MYKIMLVDDDPTSLAIGRALLEKEYQLVLVHSGLQALGFLKGGDLPDLILLDMMMPGIDGLEVLRTLKDTEVLKEIPVIFLTGESHLDKEVQGYCNGASDFLQKPVNPDMLRIKIKQQLYHLELRRENVRLKTALQAIKDQLDPIFEAALKEK